MSKQLMISIKPEHAVNILNGKKTLELRTWLPKDIDKIIAEHGGLWVNVVITKGKRLSVVHDDENGKTYYYLNSNWGRSLNQDIPFKFWFDEYYTYHHDNHGVGLYTDVAEYNIIYDDLDELCLDYREVENYGQGKHLYAWHIKKLEIFDKPKDLSEFYVVNPDVSNIGAFGWAFSEEELPKYIPLKKAPQRSVWVYE